MDDRHHRALDAGGQGLLLRGHRRVLTHDRGLVYREPPNRSRGDERARDGATNTPPQQGRIIHSDQGTQFGSWVFSQKAQEAGLAPSVGAVGVPFDNAMVEAFWARMQVELPNRRKRKTRVELATAIYDYIEIWHNTRRRHSGLNMLTPTAFENQHTTTTIAAWIPDPRLQETQARSHFHENGSTPVSGSESAIRRACSTDVIGVVGPERPQIALRVAGAVLT